jgi:RimJ/RimL family protein N-acetyltransferase
VVLIVLGISTKKTNGNNVKQIRLMIKNFFFFGGMKTSILGLHKNYNSSGLASSEEKVVLSERGEAVASLKEEKLVFTGRAEPEGWKVLRESSIHPNYDNLYDSSYTFYMEFKSGKIHKTLQLQDGRECHIRWATWDDLTELTIFINAIAQEDTWVACSPVDSETLESETKFLASALADGSLNKGSFLVAEVESRVIGTAEVRIESAVRDRSKHLASFGILVLADYRGLGMGDALIEISIDHAKNFLPAIEKIILTVFSGNEVAQNLYKKYGFSEYGRLENGLKKGGKYYDQIYMEKTL